MRKIVKIKMIYGRQRNDGKRAKEKCPKQQNGKHTENDLVVLVLRDIM